MSYSAIEKQRIRDHAERSVEDARGRLEKALRDASHTRVPEYIGFPDGLDDRLIIRHSSHRLAIGNLLRSFVATTKRSDKKDLEIEDDKEIARKILVEIETLNNAERVKKSLDENGSDSERGGKLATG